MVGSVFKRVVTGFVKNYHSRPSNGLINRNRRGNLFFVNWRLRRGRGRFECLVKDIAGYSFIVLTKNILGISSKLKCYLV